MAKDKIHSWQCREDENSPGYAKWVCLNCDINKRDFEVSQQKCKGKKRGKR